MVDRTYIEGRAAPPSTTVQFIHRTVFPVAIDAAGSVEVALNQVALTARRRPLSALTLAFCAGFGLALATRR